MSTSFSPDLLQNYGCHELLDCLSEGAYVTDTDRKILFWNRAAERITGWPAGEVIGHACRENILVHEDKDGHRLCGSECCPLYRSLITDQACPSPLLVFAQSKSGGRVPVEVTVAPIHDADGRLVGGIELFRDVTPTVTDLLRAKRIQQSCLQSTLEPDHRVRFEVRYTPCEIVGGDFYRVERIDADHYAILMADVMGHGLAAALYTVQLRALWEELRGRLDSPAAFLAQLGARLHVLARGAGYFATAVCANLNVVDGICRYVCAGHPAPLILHGDGSIKRCRDGQCALGMFPDATYTDRIDLLEAGDTLLLFTDGAVEVTNAADQELGVPGLIELVRENVASHEGGGVNLASLEEQLLRYSNRIRLADDLTLLTACRHG